LTEISILYDRSETDELGIRLTAEEMGVSLGYIPFHRVAVSIGNGGIRLFSAGKDYSRELAETRVVLNRAQSKSRRIYAASILEAAGKQVLNPLSIESACASKVRSLAVLQAAGVRIPETVYVPSNVREATPGGGEFNYSEDIAGLIGAQIGGPVVLKPDCGTHGRGVLLAGDRGSLLDALGEIAPSIVNPSGVVAQELVPKWFYDLRIIVSKERRRPFHCAPTAMARGSIVDFRTNARLGNMVFRVTLPEAVRREAARCGEALAQGAEAGVIALDAMPYFEGLQGDDAELRALFASLGTPFGEVQRAKAAPDKKTRFREYTAKVEEAYAAYMASEPYTAIQRVIQESLEGNASRVVFHEGNSCPEFWEQTRIAGGVNVGELLLRSALSLLDR